MLDQQTTVDFPTLLGLIVGVLLLGALSSLFNYGLILLWKSMRRKHQIKKFHRANPQLVTHVRKVETIDTEPLDEQQNSGNQGQDSD